MKLTPKAIVLFVIADIAIFGSLACWLLMTHACNGQNLSRANSTHPAPECRFLPAEGWKVWSSKNKHDANGNITPQYGNFIRYLPAEASQPVANVAAPEHPLMGTNGNSMHNDAYESDVNTSAGPRGINSQVVTHSEGFGGYGTLTFDRQGRIVAVYGNGKDLRLVVMDPLTLEWLYTYPLPGRSWMFPLQGVMPWKYIGAGMYFYLDQDDNAVLSTTLNTVQVIHIPKDNNDSFKLLHEYDLSKAVVQLPWPKLDSVAWVFPEWPKDGLTDRKVHRYWYATIEGLVGTFEAEPDGKQPVVHTLKLPNEIIENSFAVGEEGFFVMSDKALYRMQSRNDGSIETVWRKDYDYGPAPKPGLITRGSGSSVDLVGTPQDGLVIITDNAEPRIHVEFYRRDNGEKACSVPLFASGKSATDLSTLSFAHAGADGKANGEYTAIIENNWGDNHFPVSNPAPGVTRVDAIKQPDGSYQCNTIWESQEAGIAAGKLSLGSGLLYMYTNDDAAARGWYFTAIDFATGKTAWRQHTGIGHGFNAWQGVLFLHPSNGALYTTTIFGMVMMHDNPASAASTTPDGK